MSTPFPEHATLPYPANAWLRTIDFIDTAAQADDATAPPVNVPAAFLINGRDDTGFMLAVDRPISVEARPRDVTVVSLTVPTASIGWERDPAIPVTLSGLRILSPLTSGKDDAYAWVPDGEDGEWMRVHVFVERITFRPAAHPDEVLADQPEPR